MKNNNCLISILLISILTIACNSSKSDLKENGNIGKDITIVSENVPIADPFILLYNNTYYAYGTGSNRGFEVFYSDNLHSWKKHSEMLLKKEDSYGDKWFWAPEVYYNASNKKFYLFYSAAEHICVATADSPLGPFKQEEKKPMREERGIDSSLFIDDDGTPYLFFDRFTNGNVIWVAQLSDDWLTIKEETLTKCIEASQDWETKMGRVVEGGSVLKHKNVYYLLYSGNDFKSLDYGVGYATADSPFGPWKKAEGNPILQRPEDGLVGTGHGAYFRDKKNNYKYVFHSHFDTLKVSPRTLHIIDMSIKNKRIAFDKKTIINPYIIK
jgi:beta-xylosidase